MSRYTVLQKSLPTPVTSSCQVPLPFMKSPDEQQTGFLIQTVGGAAGEGRVKRILANKNVIL